MNPSTLTATIAVVSGAPLHDRWGSVLAFEWCAEAEYIAVAAEVISLRATAQQTDAAIARASGHMLRDLALIDIAKTQAAGLTARAVEYEIVANRILAALANKRGTTVAEQAEALKDKVEQACRGA